MKEPTLEAFYECAVPGQRLIQSSAVHAAVGSAVHAAVGSAVHAAVGSAICAALDWAICSALDWATCSALHSAICAAVTSTMCSAVGRAVCAALAGGACSALAGGACAALAGTACSALAGGACAALAVACRDLSVRTTAECAASAISSRVQTSDWSLCRSIIDACKVRIWRTPKNTNMPTMMPSTTTATVTNIAQQGCARLFTLVSDKKKSLGESHPLRRDWFAHALVTAASHRMCVFFNCSLAFARMQRLRHVRLRHVQLRHVRLPWQCRCRQRRLCGLKPHLPRPCQVLRLRARVRTWRPRLCA